MVFVFGIALLIGVVFQIVTGYALKLRPRTPGEMIDREKQRGEFWFTIAIEAALGLWCVGLVLQKGALF